LRHASLTLPTFPPLKQPGNEERVEAQQQIPSVLFWPLGNPKLETAEEDASLALDNLKHTALDITSVSEMTWWEPKEIARLARPFRKREFDAVVIFAATYATSLCAVELGKRFKLPTVIWTLPARYSLASCGLAASYLRERGYWVRLLCSEPDEPSTRSEIETVARAAHALRQSRKTRIGIVGKLSPLMISLPYNITLLHKNLGPETFEIDMQEIDKALRSVNEQQTKRTVSAYKERFQLKVNDDMLLKAVRFQLAVRTLVKKHKLDGIAIECWTRLFAKYGVNPCLGHVDDLTIGCEGDVVSLAGSLILKSINGVNPYLTDILGVDSKTNTITLSHCSAPISLAKDPSSVSLVERTDEGRKGKTVFAHFDFKNGPVTLVRFYGKKLRKVHLTWGELRSTGEYWGGIKLEVASHGDAGSFLNNVCGNHYLLTYGDVRAELRLFAEWNNLEVRED